MSYEQALDFAIRRLTDTYGDQLIAIYGIGTAFTSTFRLTSNIDLVVVVTTVEHCPHPDYSSALFEREEYHDADYHTMIHYLYGTKAMYLAGGADFATYSLADWSWAVQSLKYASKLLYGEDFREELPEPELDVEQIFLRAAYQIDKAFNPKTFPDYLSLTKGIFKLGFFVAAIYTDPEAENWGDLFRPEGVEAILQDLAAHGHSSQDMIEIYHAALQYRQQRDPGLIPDFEAFRKEISLTLLRETLNHTDYTWTDLDALMAEGLGGKGFSSLRTALAFWKEG